MSGFLSIPLLLLLALAGCVSSTLSVGPKPFGEYQWMSLRYSSCILLAVLPFAVVVSVWYQWMSLMYSSCMLLAVLPFAVVVSVW